MPWPWDGHRSAVDEEVELVVPWGPTPGLLGEHAPAWQSVDRLGQLSDQELDAVVARPADLLSAARADAGRTDRPLSPPQRGEGRAAHHRARPSGALTTAL